MRQLWGIELDNIQAKIALITNDSDLSDLLEESFLMHGKFSVSLYTNSSVHNLIKKVDLYDVILISNDVLDESDKEVILFFRGIGKKSFYLVKNIIKKNFLENKNIVPRSIINIPFSFHNIIQKIEIQMYGLQDLQFYEHQGI